MALGNSLFLLHLALTLPTAQVFAEGGVPVWTNRYNEIGTDAPSAIAVGRSGKVFVTGNSQYSMLTIAYSDAGIPLWTNRYHTPGVTADYATAIAVDGSDNVFVAGVSRDSLQANGYTTVAYTVAGIPLWTNHSGNRIAVDSKGNLFVTGPSSSGGSSNYTTIKYSGAGMPLWTNRFDGSKNNDDPALAVDANDNVFVTGCSYRGDYVDSSDYGTVAYSGEGVPLWTNRYNGPGNNTDKATAIAVDSHGNVFVTGWSYRGSTFSSADCVTVAYSGAGVPLWTNRYNGPENDADLGSKIVADRNGNVFVTGISYGSNHVNGNAKFVTIQYSGAGVPLWTKLSSGGGMAVDSDGNVFLEEPGFTTAAYSNAGLLLWTNRYTEPADVFGLVDSMAVDSSGNVFVLGFSYNQVTDQDFVTIKYSSSVSAPRLNFQLLNHQLVLMWTNSTLGLQSAPAVTGTFTNLGGVTSPYTNPLNGSAQFFRLKGN